MSNLPFNVGIPTAGNNPSDDQPLMLTNTTSENAIWAVDHHGFNDVTNISGYHTNIHQDALLADPAIIAAINQFYVKSVTPDTTGGAANTQLFARTSLGNISQMTGYLASSQGWQWIGGLLIQYGLVTLSTGAGNSTHRTGTLTLKDRVAGAIPFPNNCFGVVATFTNTDVTQTTASLNVTIREVLPTSFTWVANSSSSNMLTDNPTFFWIAVGN